MNSGIGLVFNSERREKQHYIIFELFMKSYLNLLLSGKHFWRYKKLELTLLTRYHPFGYLCFVNSKNNYEQR